MFNDIYLWSPWLLGLKKNKKFLLDQFYDESKPLVYGANENFLSR
jgi:hypothetical protein